MRFWNVQPNGVMKACRDSLNVRMWGVGSGVAVAVTVLANTASANGIL